MVMFADEGIAQRVGLALQVQRQENTSVNIFLAEQKFLLNDVKSVQRQLESMQRDLRFVSGIHTCFHSVTHVQDTLHDVGTQLWGDQGPMNGEIYANKLVCIEPNVELLQFLEREQNPKGVPPEIQKISAMVETALLVSSLHKLTKIIGDNGKSFNITTGRDTPESGTIAHEAGAGRRRRSSRAAGASSRRLSARARRSENGLCRLWQVASV
jgi:hypothetical protein